MVNTYLFMIAPVLTLVLICSANASEAARVLVYGVHQGNNIVYHYTIINNGTKPINNVVIGSRWDAVAKETWPELGKLPKNSSFGHEGEGGTEIIIGAGSVTQPEGWTASIYGAQDSGFYSLHWSSVNMPISPGASLSGFAVTVSAGQDSLLGQMPEGSDIKYLTGNFTIRFGSDSNLHGSIERKDVSGPTLNVQLTPTSLWPPNGRPVKITANVSVSDDYDSAPVVKLESIVANEALAQGDVGSADLGTDDRSFLLTAKRLGTNQQAGRVYTVTYSATDASGNRSTASTSIAAPHDHK